MIDWPLWSRIRSHARAAPDRPAYVELSTGRSISYAHLAERVERHAPVDEFDPVVQFGNVIGAPLLFLARLVQGRGLLPTSPDAPLLDIERTRDKARSFTSVGPDEGALLLCSSGTTGLPKLVRRSRASLAAVARGMVEAIGIENSDRVIAAVPLVHSYGFEHGLLAPLWAGATVLLCEGLNLLQIRRALSAGATVFPAVPSIVEMLAGASDVPTHALRCVYSAGAPLPAHLSKQFTARYGVGVGQVYGLTEVGSVTYNDPQRDTPGTVGRPFTGVSVRILDQDETGEGEVAIAAPSMLTDYANEPLGLVNGHFRTGDLGRLTSSGELQLTGRLRLLIDVGGAKVNPLEVEQALMDHPAVASAVVVPLHLSETVRKIRAIIVPVDPSAAPSPAELRAFLKARLPPYKIPRVIDVRPSLPRSPTGKVLRHLVEAG